MNDDPFYENYNKYFKDKPHGWIQWKGTDVCAEIYCPCGAHHHYDGDFMYQVKCTKCGTVWDCEGWFFLKKSDEPEDEFTKILITEED